MLCNVRILCMQNDMADPNPIQTVTSTLVFYTHASVCNPTHFDINVAEQILQTITFCGGGGGGGEDIHVRAAIDQRI